MNAILVRLKNSIDQKVLAAVDKNQMAQNKFIPISLQKGDLYVAITHSTDRDHVCNLLKKTFSQPIKFILVTDDDLSELLSLLNGGNSATNQNLISDPMKISVTKKPNEKLGEILIEKGVLNEVQLVKALSEAKKKGIPVGSMLFEMGIITLDQLKDVLHFQTGYDFVTEDQLINQEDFVNILPEDFIKEKSVIPISSDGKTLLVGAVKPMSPDVIKDIIYMTGLNPRQLLMTHYEFQTAINTFFSQQQQQTAQILDQLKTEKSVDNDAPLWAQVQEELQDTDGAVAKFANQIITNAIDNKVSDIHIEPRLSGYIVRYRKDGMLQKVLDVPKNVESAIISRFKVLSRMNIAESRRPQDGTFTHVYKDCSYDFRINTLPVAGREKVVIRILAPAVSLESGDKKISLVGADEEDLQKIKQMVTCPNGIILTSGPTGSGKTTTLYSILKSLNDESVNITTIEDPIEIKLDGINQSQINPKAGITFASCMRAILRQDPDIILVGEIRDYETLEIAISAALTGHLVLSTVHTNSAAATVTRMIEMGAKDYLVSSTLSGVIAQRLVRRLCDHCKEEYHITREEALKMTQNEDEIKLLMETPLYRAKGCKKCNHGYKGRLAVFEILQVTREIKKLIAQGAHDLEIEECATGNGMRTLQQSCIKHILKGETTVEEFIRVLGLAGD